MHQKCCGGDRCLRGCLVPNRFGGIYIALLSMHISITRALPRSYSSLCAERFMGVASLISLCNSSVAVTTLFCLYHAQALPGPSVTHAPPSRFAYLHKSA